MYHYRIAQHYNLLQGMLLIIVFAMIIWFSENVYWHDLWLFWGVLGMPVVMVLIFFKLPAWWLKRKGYSTHQIKRIDHWCHVARRWTLLKWVIFVVIAIIVIRLYMVYWGNHQLFWLFFILQGLYPFISTHFVLKKRAFQSKKYVTNLN